MKKAEEDYELIRHYLLGDLSGHERELFEERVITDPSYKESVLMVEAELIEDYLEDDLPEVERQKFIRHFLSTPQQLQKLEFSQALKRYAMAAASSPVDDKLRRSAEDLEVKHRSWWSQFLRIQRPVLGFSLAAAVLLALFAAWLFLIRDRRTPLELELARLNNQSNSESPLTPKGSVLSVPLTPGRVRGPGKENEIKIAPGTDVVQLQLALMVAERPSYRATLLTPEGAEIFTLDGLKAKELSGVRQVTLNIPAGALSANDYLLMLSELTSEGRFVEVAEYSFRVTG